MQPRNNPRRSFVHISEADRRAIIEQHRRQQLARRIRRVAKVAIIAAKTGTSSRKRKLLYYKRQVITGLRVLHQNQYRLIAGCFVVVFALGSFLPTFLQADTSKSTSLSAEVKALVGESRDDAKEHLKFDSKEAAYVFEVPEKDTAGVESTGRKTDAYATTLATRAEDGITVTDQKTKIAVTLAPEFFSTPARKSEGNHIVYRSGKQQLIYTLKYNGLKEDIIVTEFAGETLSYTFKLKLPSGVEARLDEQGNIGIYSSDPVLFGNISFDKEQDRASVEKAREKAEKTHLVMTIPYPIVKDSTGTEYTDRATFSLGEKRSMITDANLPKDLPAEVAQQTAGKTTLNEYTLMLKAENLKNLAYPISIDPTMQVTSSADFSNLDTENATTDTTNNLIKRTGLTGGLLGSWSSLANFDTNNATRSQATVGRAPDGSNYIYVIGDRTTDIRYAKLNTDGTLGSWASMATDYPEAVAQASVVSYNGFVYVAGGNLTTNNELSRVYHAKIGANGVITSWATTSSLAVAVYMAGSFAHNNRIYLLGGYISSETPIVQFANINADGSLAAWATTTSLPAGRSTPYAAVYNNMAYLLGGNAGVNTASSTVYGGKINADGTITSWQTLSSMTTARVGLFAGASGGYMYASGGCSAQASFSCTTFTNSTEYAEIYADGTLGAWRTTTAFTTARAHTMGAIHNNFIYIIGGCSALDNFLSESCGTAQQTVQYAQVQAVGMVAPWAATSGLGAGNGSWAGSSVAVNGYIYYSGGMQSDCSGLGCVARSNVFSATINSDGSISSWAANTALPVGLAGHKLVAAGGYVYSLAGASTCLNNATFGFFCSGNTSVYYAFVNNNGSLGSWQTATGYNNGRFHPAVAVYGGKYLYISGGSTCSGSTCTVYSDVQYALINADGTVGTWNSTTNLPQQFSAHSMAVYGQYMYLLGGMRTGPAAVRYIGINSNGTLTGTWTSTTSIPTGSYYTYSFAVKGYLYTFAGNADATGDPLKVAPINADGSLGNWTTLNSYATTRHQPAGAAYGDTLYMVSGSNAGASTMHTDTQYTNIHNGGQGVTNSWSASQPLGSGHTRTGLIALNGYLYVAAGCSTNTNPCTAVSGVVEYAAIQSNGTLSAWANTSASITPRQGATYYTYNGRIYIQAGTNPAGNVYTRVIEFATPASNGDITSWTTNTIDASTNESYGSAAVHDGYVYRVGGINGIANHTNVSYAPINADTGQVGAWTSMNNLAFGRYMLSAVVYKNYIYAVGGNFGGDSSTTIEYAAINADHSLGSWKPTTGFSIARQEVAAVALNGMLCVVGGYNPSYNRVSRTECAPILASGDIGNWRNGGTSITGVAGGSCVVYRGNIYKVGGTSNSADPALGTEITTVNAMARVANLSKLYDFDVGVKPAKLITRGTKQTGAVVGVEYTSTNNGLTALGNPQTVSDTVYGGTGAPALSLGANRTLSRYILVRYTIDDTFSAVFPDAGNESTITDFDLYYTANPGSRLKGGRTFTDGVDRGLEANPQ